MGKRNQKLMEEAIKNIQDKFLGEITKAGLLAELDRIFISLFGKNGEFNRISARFGSLSKDELKTLAPIFSDAKTRVEQAIAQKRISLLEEGYLKLEDERLVLEDTKIKARTGHMHPLTQFEERITEAFKKLGFSLYCAPHIDSDYFNFEVLNIPEEHPARDLWDTLYIAESGEGRAESGSKLLLRTHTSNGQVRIMREFKPPFRKMLIDRCYRKENLDARHEHTFDQFEIVMVEKGLNMGHLQFLSEYFFRELFGPEIKAKLKPKYYPFVEPGAGVDGLCIFCKGKGCRICGNTGWLELAGAGMIHPTVLKNGGIDADEYTGIAWGMGPGRMAMLKYGVEDVRLFNSGDLRFLQKF